ncbi:WW domain-binding protein 4 isoform 2-T2 [Anomaloglossus baeobatrachus]|uniref:WW domain-binding protein 4 isoform X2 n=1 Tax=Anomaloglossus baeobatrachus TaxID=238106 RepID=UPI003F50C711
MGRGTALFYSVGFLSLKGGCPLLWCCHGLRTNALLIKQKSVAKAKADKKKSKEFAAMEEAALKAYEEDLKRLEGAKPAPPPLVGLTIEERRARDEQKRMEIDALEKHHAKRQWTKSLSPEGYPYFYNLLTGESQWEEPEGFNEKIDQNEKEPKSTWMEGVSEEGYTYYYNSETGESRWDKPEHFDTNLPPDADQKDSTEAKDVSAADEQETANPEVTTDSSSEESPPSEDTTQTPTIAQTPKINYRAKKESKSDSDEGSDPEPKQEKAAEKKVPPPKSNVQKPAKANPYGAWETVQEDEDPYENVDLELPNVEYDNPDISVPDVPQEPKVKFKEKTITSLGDSAAGASVFKRRKLENVKSRNIRQRLNDQ